jgi:hypothetical protein
MSAAQNPTSGWSLHLAPKRGGSKIEIPLSEVTAQAILAQMPEIVHHRDRGGEALEPKFSIYLARS